MPFSIINTITSWFLKKRIHQIELFKKYPIEVQNEVLMSLIKSAENTEFGKKYHFNNIRDYKTFSKNIPISNYEDFFKYIKRSIEGEKNIFWNSEIKWYAQSCGTTNSKSKFIPVSKESLEDCHYKAGKDVLCLYINNNENSNLFSGKSLRLGGSKKILNDGNKYFGDLSAILIDNLPVWAEMMSTPNNEISLMDKWDEKLDAVISSTINEDVTSLAGVPSWMLIMINKVLKERKVNHVKEIWKNLEVYFHGGVDFKPYKNQFKKILGNNVLYYEIYNASEGFFAIQDRNDKNDMLLMLDYGIYFEFQEYSSDGTKNDEIINLSKVKLDTNYAIIISTNAGLWRYKIGDTVKFTSLSPFRIKITGRTKSFINAFGEELIIENAEKAINKALIKHNSTMIEYTVAPSFINKNKTGFHEWLIEFEIKPNDISSFKKDLDINLQELNTDYKAKRFKNITMDELKITVAKKNIFYDWLKQNNKLGGQNKVPRLSNDRKIIDELLKIN